MPCRTVYEGTTAIQAVQGLLRPIGMTLKGADGPPVDLLQGHKATILGLSIHWDNGQINYDLTEGAWTNLGAKLSETHTHTSPEAANQATKGWMAACGPAFVGKLENPILDRALEIGAKVGHRELSRRRLKQYLQSSRDRWADRRRNAHKVSKGTRARQGAAAPLTADPPGITMPEAGPSQEHPAAVSAPF